MASVENLSTEPLALEAFPGALKKHVDPKAPPPLRDMGAKGLVPGIDPLNLTLILYQLRFDPLENIAAAAVESFNDLPDEIATVAARGELPEPVLDYFARSWLHLPLRLDLLLANSFLSDISVAFLASKGEERQCSIIADNQVRLSRTPAIIEQLYLNPNTPQTAVDRVLEFAGRQDLELSGLPGLHGAIKAAEPLTSGGDNPPNDDEFAAFLKQSIMIDEEDERTVSEIKENLEGDERKFVSRQVVLGAMNISQRIRMATLGSKEDRSILIKDNNRLIHMAAITSPKVQRGDRLDYASNRNLPDGAINYIANRGDSLRDYQMLMRLMNNPKLHLKRALKMLNYVREGDLKKLSRSRAVSPQLKKMAKNLTDKRSKRKN